MSAITIYYLVFAAIDLALGYGVYRGWRTHINVWRGDRNAFHILLLLLAGALLVLASALTLFLLFFTWDSWRVARDPTRPKPMFEFIWIFAVLAAGISAGFASSIHALVRRD